MYCNGIMKVLLNCIVQLLILVSCLFLSCNKDDLSSVNAKNDIEITSVSVTAFSATVTGVFKNITKTDIALGKNGVLYCPQTDTAEAIFNNWINGNDHPQCEMFIDNRGFNGDVFSGKIGDLYPGTEYSYCFFSQGQDASNRKISSISSFTTNQFAPDISETIVSDIGFITAKTSLSVKMEKTDAPYCKIGVQLSDKSDAPISSSTVAYFEGEYGQKITYSINIQPEHNYYCRTIVEYKSPDGKKSYCYGPESIFTSRNTNDFCVDLGLPSGIRWGIFEIGGYEWIGFVENTSYTPDFNRYFHYRWGSLKIVKDRYDYRDNSRYEYWDSKLSKCVDIGSDISGTEYDIVHKLCGGKWRLPRLEDVVELLTCCDCSNFAEKRYNPMIDGKEYPTDIAYVGIARGTNGNSIFMGNDNCWTGTIIENNNTNAYCFYWTAPKISSTSMTPKTGEGNVIVAEANRVMPYAIRPVWDPNM